MTGIELITAERRRQIKPKEEGGEGWDADHDRGHGEALAKAAAVYALDQRVVSLGMGGWSVKVNLLTVLWPWATQWWKPTPEDRIRELTKAGALIAAAIDSIQADQERSQP